MTTPKDRFVFFDRARSFGLVNGLVHVEIVANVLKPGDTVDVAVEDIEVAQLRCSIPAAKSLIAALQQAIGETGGQVPPKGRKKPMN